MEVSYSLVFVLPLCIRLQDQAHGGWKSGTQIPIYHKNMVLAPGSLALRGFKLPSLSVGSLVDSVLNLLSPMGSSRVVH